MKNSIQSLGKLTALFTAAFLTVSADAAPVTYYLNATYAPYTASEPNGTVVGSFTYDDATLNYTDVNLEARCDGFCTWNFNFTFTESDQNGSPYDTNGTPFYDLSINQYSQGDFWSLYMDFANSTLPSTGETIDITFGALGRYSTRWSSQQYVSLTGTLSHVNTVPVPAAAWLMGSGLIGLAGIARRKK